MLYLIICGTIPNSFTTILYAFYVIKTENLHSIIQCTIAAIYKLNVAKKEVNSVLKTV